MKKTLIKEIPFGKAFARITVSISERDINLDGHNVGSELKTTKKVEIVANGKVVGNAPVVRLLDAGDRQVNKTSKLDAAKEYTQVGDRCFVEGKETGLEIIAVMEALEKEIASELNVKTESEKNDEIDLAEAKEIIALVEKIGADKLVSASVLKQKRIAYNNHYNEGGEGDLPIRLLISREMYEYACDKLNRLK